MKGLTQRDFLVARAASLAALAAGCSLGTGQQKAASSGGNNITVWDVKTGDEQRKISGGVCPED